MKKILVIDDDEAILHATKLILELQGYSVETYTNTACIKKLDKEKPNLILLDVMLSGEDGREICKKLKKHKATHTIPIILFSANARSAIIANQKEIMNDGFIEKPFDMDHLIQTVRQFVP
ncbi:MAG: response regulator [Patescibacteria group bacterium]